MRVATTQETPPYDANNLQVDRSRGVVGHCLDVGPAKRPGCTESHSESLTNQESRKRVLASARSPRGQALTWLFRHRPQMHRRPRDLVARSAATADLELHQYQPIAWLPQVTALLCLRPYPQAEIDTRCPNWLSARKDQALVGLPRAMRRPH